MNKRSLPDLTATEIERRQRLMRQREKEIRARLFEPILDSLLKRMLDLTSEKNLVKQIYIAGPMSGYPEFNFPAFFKAQKHFEELGWKVWNPANKEAEQGTTAAESFAKGDNAGLVAEGWDWRGAFDWDCNKVIYGDAIYMLKGWEYSPGATAEHAVAKFAKKQYPEYQIIYE
jgi:hypothetical protein